MSWGARARVLVGALLGLVMVAPAALADPAAALGGARPAYRGFVVPVADEAESFAVAYDVRADGSVQVTQTIRWQFPDGEERHGIIRNIKVRVGYQDSETQYRAYELTEVSVSSPTGAPTDISISDFGAFRQLRIGSPSETVTGVQEYVVRFTLGHVVNDIGDGTAEFYYNLVDSSNDFPHRGISATVKAPVPSTRAACYVGELLSETPCPAQAGAVARFSAPDVDAGQGVSIVTSYPRDAFGDLTPDLREGAADAESSGTVSPVVSRTAGYLFAGVGVALPLLAGALMGLLVWRRGRDEQYAGLTPGLSPGLGQDVPVERVVRQPAVAVAFTPPAGVQPGMVGTIIDEEVNLVDVTSTLVDLAVRGHLQITRSELAMRPDDWTLTRQQPPANAAALAPYEQVLLDGIFAGGSTVELSDLKNSFKPTLDVVQRMMYDEVVQRGWFRRSPDAQRSAWTGFGLLLIFGSVALAMFGGSVLGGLLVDAGLPVSPLFILAAGGVVAGLIVRLLGQRMASRTAAGSAVLAQSRGFERYLATAEANQIRWEEAQEIFSRYLPFAIVFGLADRWAQVFQEVAAAAAAAGHVVSPPIWYGGAWGQGGFHDVASSMDSFSTMAAGTFVSTPGSSGGSGFNDGGGGGFDGGGGFSGGGGGGDSGGSW